MDYQESNSFEDWCIWMTNLRLPSKLKQIFEGICYIVWWFVWKWRNTKIFGQEDHAKANVLDEVTSRSFLWIRSRCKTSFSFIDWLKNPNLISL